MSEIERDRKVIEAVRNEGKKRARQGRSEATRDYDLRAIARYHLLVALAEAVREWARYDGHDLAEITRLANAIKAALAAAEEE